MTDEREDLSPEPASPTLAREAGAWGCALLAGIAFAVAVGSPWLLVGATGEGHCIIGFPCTVYPAWAVRLLVAVVALVSGAYALRVRATMLRPRPGAGRKPRPPLWAVLTGLTLFASFVGGWLVMLATILLRILI